MKGNQALLFPDAKPLVERLGGEFFRKLPESPGVYLMRDHADAVVYVGKAKNLRKRLGSYRVANPDRLPKRLIRLLNSAVTIEYRECVDEPAALAREAELLRELKPRFNRAGVWPAPAKVLAWRVTETRIELALRDATEEGWQQQGLSKGGASIMFLSLVRVLWSLAHPERGLAGMPSGWFHGQFPQPLVLHQRGQVLEEWILNFARAEAPCPEVTTLLENVARLHPAWQTALLAEDLEVLANYFRRGKARE